MIGSLSIILLSLRQIQGWLMHTIGAGRSRTEWSNRVRTPNIAQVAQRTCAYHFMVMLGAPELQVLL